MAPAAAEAAAPTLPRLRAELNDVEGGRIVDIRGRTVLLRGVNVNALADYWQGSSLPTVFPLGSRDPQRMAAIGWNAVRLLVSWSRIEPLPGQYDDQYLGTVAATVERLRRQGIYTIVDFHQDAWSASLAGRTGEVCVPPAQPALGWDGAPAWATLDGGQPRCYTQFRETSPAVMRAWQAFLGDEAGPGAVGIQTRYLAMLRHVAQRFARDPALAGYDVVNEPNAFGDPDLQRLSQFYGRALEAVRAGERDVRGFKHIVFFEPSALYSAIRQGVPPDFTTDPNVVYAPHIYQGGFDGTEITQEAFQQVAREARDYGGVPVLSGEWGSDPDRARNAGDRYFIRHQDLQDRFLFSSTLWTWRESCGDPHKVLDTREGRAPKPWGEFDLDCATNTVRGERADLIDQLRRGYVRAAPGDLHRMAWSESRGRLRVAGASARGVGPLIAFYPRSEEGGMRVRTLGFGRRVRVTRAPGGGRWIVAHPVGGSWSLTVTRR